MQKTDASVIPVQWSVSWGVASKAAFALSFPTRTFQKFDRETRTADTFSKLIENLVLGRMATLVIAREASV